MLPCAILGDSLAEGVAVLRPECLSDPKVGITSAAYVAGHLVAAAADRVLISLGVNDGAPTLATAEHLSMLHASLQARPVYLDAAGPPGRHPCLDRGSGPDVGRQRDRDPWLHRA